MRRIHFGNLVEEFAGNPARTRALVSKVEKLEELFALEMQRDERAFSS
jgi:hypothetical protein